MTEKFDAIIIGTGQSGPSLAARMTKEGLKTAIIERKLFGGTCVNVGCIPTKTLVASARAAYMARRGGDFGVMIDGAINVDMKQVKARKDGVVQKSNQGVTNWMMNMDGLTVYEGHGRFENPNTVRVNGDLLEADRIILNTGARAVVPDMAGLDQVDYLTNSSVMDIDFLPEHLVIIGGSYIGLEFAQMYRRFGSRVTVVDRNPRLIGRDDEDVSAAVKDIVENEGVEVRLNADCMTVEKRGEGFAVNLSCDDGPNEVEGTHLLLAVGRRPNTDILAPTKPVSRPTRATSFRSMTNCEPMFRVSGRLAMSTDAVRSPTPPTMIMRCWPPTCLKTIPAVPATASPPMACSLIRLWGVPV